MVVVVSAILFDPKQWQINLLVNFGGERDRLMLLDQHPLIINFRGETPNKSERWCWMLKTTVAKQMNNFTALPLPPFLFWGRFSLCEVSSMLMSDASLSKAYNIVGLDKIESGFGRKLHTRVIELIIVVKLPSLTRWPLLHHHHFSDTTKSIWFLRSERCLLPSFFFGPDVLGVIYICWHLPRRIDLTRSFFLACYFIQLFNVSDYI